MESSSIVKHSHEDMKTMLSVERLDYSKGIPDRLRAFDAFLERYPEWIEHVHLTLVTVPSRENVPSYKRLKKEVDELVGRINGKYSTLEWTPLSYYYRPLPFELLCLAYRECDVMLVTPLRDGMNLVSKEYLAVHDDEGGVLILSEMAGAAGELSEAVLVNPFDQNALVEAMHDALTMPKGEQIRRNKLMQRRLRRYTSDKWSHEFLSALDQVKGQQRARDARILGSTAQQRLVHAYRSAAHRALLLDYDGTLVPFSTDPASTHPDADLRSVLQRLAADACNEVAILSGRDRMTLQEWLGDLPLTLVAEHGAWSWNSVAHTWTMRVPLDDAWKERIRPILQDYTDRTPGSALEEKDYSLVWHYRACGTELAQRRVTEIKNDLTESIGDLGLQLADGNKIVEVKMENIDKGSAAYRWLSDESYDFILVCGDDLTDEDMFRAAPDRAWTVKVGAGSTLARYTLKSYRELRFLLEQIAQDG
jgi:trehalose 6-phosphate synthase/phosphatase